MIEELLKKISEYIVANPSVILSWTWAIVSFVFSIFIFRYKSKIEHEFSVTLEQKKSEFQKSLQDYWNFVEKRNWFYKEIYELAQKVLWAFPWVSWLINYPFLMMIKLKIQKNWRGIFLLLISNLKQQRIILMIIG